METPVSSWLTNSVVLWLDLTGLAVITCIVRGLPSPNESKQSARPSRILQFRFHFVTAFLVGVIVGLDVRELRITEWLLLWSWPFWAIHCEFGLWAYPTNAIITLLVAVSTCGIQFFKLTEPTDQRKIDRLYRLRIIQIAIWWSYCLGTALVFRLGDYVGP